MDKIRQNRAAKGLIAFSCSTAVVWSFSDEQFCSHLSDARWYHPLDLSGLLMVGSPYIAGRHQKFQQSLVQGWLPLSLHIKPICPRWLDFTFEKHNHNFWWLLPAASQRFGPWQKSNHRQDWFKEMTYCRTLRIACFGYMRIGAYFPVTYLIFETFPSYLQSHKIEILETERNGVFCFFSTLSCAQSVSVVLVQLPRKQL